MFKKRKMLSDDASNEREEPKHLYSAEIEVPDYMDREVYSGGVVYSGSSSDAAIGSAVSHVYELCRKAVVRVRTRDCSSGHESWTSEKFAEIEYKGSQTIEVRLWQPHCHV